MLAVRGGARVFAFPEKILWPNYHKVGQGYYHHRMWLSWQAKKKKNKKQQQQQQQNKTKTMGEGGGGGGLPPATPWRRACLQYT